MQRDGHIGQAYPGLKVLLPLLAGIGFSTLETGGSGTYVALALMILLACIVLGFLKSKHGTGHFVLGWNLAFFLLWFSLGAFVRLYSKKQKDYSFPEEKQGYQVILLTQPQPTAKTMRAEALVLYRFSEDSLWAPKRKIRLSLWKDTASMRLTVGDALSFRASVRPLRPSGNPYEFDYASYLKRAGFVGEAMLFQQSWESIPRESGDYARLYQEVPLWQRTKLFFLTLRQELVKQMRADGLSGEAFAVYAALTMGEKAFLSKETEELYSRTGTTHILALSGMHLSILMFFFYYIFAHGLKYSRWRWCFCFLAVILVWSYTLLAGMPVSLVRASVMYTFSLCGMMMLRRGFSLNILFWTASLMLLVDPDTLLDVGFQLSFAAMLGILLLQKRIESMVHFRWTVLQSLWSGIAVSLAAQITTLPLVVYYFHYVATTSIWATLILSFLSSFLLYLLPVYLLLFRVEWISGVLLQGVSVLIDWQHSVLRWFSSWPSSMLGPFYLSWPEILAVYLCLLMSVLFLRLRHKLFPALGLVISLSACVLWRSVESYRLDSSFPVLAFYNNYRAPSVHIIYSPDRSYLLQSKDTVNWNDYTYIKENFWNRFTDSLPTVLSGQRFSDDYLCCAGGLLFTRDFRLGFLHGNIPENISWTGVGQLDYLVLGRGFKGDLEKLTWKLTPKLVVLDRSLTDYEYKRYLHLCIQKKWKYHDMRREGALKVAF